MVWLPGAGWTPVTVIARLHAETARTLAMPEVRKRLAADSAEPIGNTPAEFSAFLKEEIERWTAVAKTAGIKPVND